MAEQYHTFAEVRRILNVAENTLIRMLYAGDFTGARKVNNQWRIPCFALDQYLDKQIAELTIRRNAKRQEKRAYGPDGNIM